jgi:hypothetical protein
MSKMLVWIRQTNKHMNKYVKTQYFGLWKPLKLRLAQKNEAKKYCRTYKVR